MAASVHSVRLLTPGGLASGSAVRYTQAMSDFVTFTFGGALYATSPSHLDLLRKLAGEPRLRGFTAVLALSLASGDVVELGG